MPGSRPHLLVTNVEVRQLQPTINSRHLRHQARSSRSRPVLGQDHGWISMDHGQRSLEQVWEE